MILTCIPHLSHFYLCVISELKVCCHGFFRMLHLSSCDYTWKLFNLTTLPSLSLFFFLSYAQFHVFPQNGFNTLLCFLLFPEHFKHLTLMVFNALLFSWNSFCFLIHILSWHGKKVTFFYTFTLLEKWFSISFFYLVSKFLHLICNVQFIQP